MGKEWDGWASPASFERWCMAWARECLRLLKPGGHLLAFGGSRTWHRLAVAVEDAGFEIRDSIAWLYGQGFPKSLDVSKAIDKAAGAEREVIGRTATPFKVDAAAHRGTSLQGSVNGDFSKQTDEDGYRYTEHTAPATPDAERWQGWGTALKPAWENVVVGRKPPALCDRIGSRLDALEDECRRLANGAAKSSVPTRHDSPEVTTATAPASAATPPEGEPARTIPTGAAADSSETTATSWSEWQATACSNIVTSWKRSLAVVSQPTSTSTTAITSGMTTDLTTLWSSLSQITEPSTLLSETSPDGLSSLARIVDDLFGAALLNWRATRTLTATEPATSAMPHDSPDGGARLSPIVVARKPLSGSTVAANVLQHGTGALNIDACRVEGEPWKAHSATGLGKVKFFTEGETPVIDKEPHTAGRWPANVVLDEPQAEALDHQSGIQRGASRFFYVAKAPQSERPKVDGVAHPTVKPLALMQWLIRLVTPPGGHILDPFAGSGTTVEAALRERVRITTIEREADYLPLILHRIERHEDAP